MLLISITLSLSLLTAVYVGVRWWSSPVAQYLWAFGFFAIAPLCLTILMPIVLLQGLFMIAIVAYFSKGTRQPAKAVAYGLGATLIVYAVFLTWTMFELNHLRRRFPIESLEARLPLPQTAQPVPAKAIEAVSAIEHHFEEEGAIGRHYRTFALERLHDRTITDFVARAGFGVARMPDPISYLKRIDDEFSDATIAQPTPPTVPLSAGDSRDFAEPLPSNLPFRSLHQSSVLNFLERSNSGSFPRRDRVIGFDAHRFTKLPPSPDSFHLRSIELVGLVVHPTPVVYLSANLPNMKELAVSPTRPLDAFETDGHAKLLQGDTLFARKAVDDVRVLGAIRAMESCTTCHGCERGTLLGAFSYTLRR